MIAHFHTIHLIGEFEYLVKGSYLVGGKGIDIESVEMDGYPLTTQEFACKIPAYDRFNLIESLMRKLNPKR